MKVGLNSNVFFEVFCVSESRMLFLGKSGRSHDFSSFIVVVNSPLRCVLALTKCALMLARESGGEHASDMKH